MIRFALLLLAALATGAVGGSVVIATAPALAPEPAATSSIPKTDRAPVHVVAECRSA